MQIGHGNPAAAFVIRTVLSGDLRPYLNNFRLGPLHAGLVAKFSDITKTSLDTCNYTFEDGRDINALTRRVFLGALRVFNQLTSECRGVIGTQELALLAACRMRPLRRSDNPELLFVSDAYTKKDAYPVIKKIPGVEILVWNELAKKKLVDQEVMHEDSVKVVSIPFLDILRRKSNEMSRHTRSGIYVKTSGGGLDNDTLSYLGNLPQVVLHLPHNFDLSVLNGQEIISYEDIWDIVDEVAGHMLTAETVITQPSEMVKYFAALAKLVKEQKASTEDVQESSLWTMPTFGSLVPKGKHEIENLKFGIKYGLIDFIILPSEEADPEDRWEKALEGVVDGKVQMIRVNELKDVDISTFLRRDEQDKQKGLNALMELLSERHITEVVEEAFPS